MNHRTTQRLVATVLYAVASILLLGAVTGCVGGPRSAVALEEMDEAAYQSWLGRVRAWTALGATEYVKHNDPEPVRAFAAALSIVAGGEIKADALARVGRQFEISAPVLMLLALEGQALIDARGGLLQLGARASEVLLVVAEAAESAVTR